MTLFFVSLQKNKQGYDDGVVFQIAWFAGPAHLWYEDDERRLAENGGTKFKTHISPYDRQSAEWHADRNDGDLCRAVVVGHNGHDGLVCLSRTAHAGAGHISHHGCQHRHDTHGVDHVVGI